MSDSQSTFAPGPQVANPFLEPQAQQLAFQGEAPWHIVSVQC